MKTDQLGPKMSPKLVQDNTIKLTIVPSLEATGLAMFWELAEVEAGVDGLG